jgi:hypothetical protein
LTGRLCNDNARSVPQPEPPPKQGLGSCLAAFLVLVGVVLMLPGFCAFMIAGQSRGGGGIAGLGVILLLSAVAAGGMWLIVWALERR